MMTDTLTDPAPVHMGGADPATVRAITARLRAIGSVWAARIIEIDAGLGRFDADGSYRGKTINAHRELADLLESNPNMPLPFGAASLYWNVTEYHRHTQEKQEIVPAMRAIRRVLGGAYQKNYGSDDFEMRGRFADYFDTCIFANRESVCEKVVVGQKTEVKAVQDPELVAKATAEIPFEEIEVTTDVTEWICPEDIS